MDEFYQISEARKGLESIVEERTSSGPKCTQLVQYSDNDGASNEAHPIVSNHVWKLASPINSEDVEDGKDGVLEEIVLRIQGIICKKNLPPIRNPIPSHRVQFYKQLVTLTAFNSPYFQSCIDNIHDIHQKFSQRMPENSLEPLVMEMFEEYRAITISNRYCTSRNKSPTHSSIPFKSCVDPDQILQFSMGAEFIHTAENEVEYFKFYPDENGSNQYRNMDPSLFRIGDIVEVQLSFVVVPVKNNRSKMINVLRAVTLLDPKYQMDSAIIRNRAEHNHTRHNPNITLKRKVGYCDEAEKTPSKIAKMTIDNL
ncbi:hypothetical protein BDZ94DRAFT_1307255 [Collybia nuda]|uniref:Uncharacterized protein n=1 Tax=Collybia nuda TaxID=64659 RepID=A0A9P5Y8N5_9AGAR|nr:hypothetical protein BDZ94DRAFT_1307255 [Collybia nuda]